MSCGNVNTMSLDALRYTAKVLGVKDKSRKKGGDTKTSLRDKIVKKLGVMKVPIGGSAAVPFSRSSKLVKKKK